MNPLTFGIPGAAIILLAFALNVSGRVKATDRNYLMLNIVGSALLILYAVLLQSIPFILLNAVWVGVAVQTLAKQRKKKK